MVTVIYQFVLFFVILGTYGSMRAGYMDIQWNFLLSLYGMFVGFLVMFYFSVYKSPEFSKRKIKIIAIISSILTIIIIFILGHLMWILLTKQISIKQVHLFNYCYFIPIALLTLSLGTLNNPKTCRMVGLIAHAMPTFVYKFS